MVDQELGDETLAAMREIRSRSEAHLANARKLTAPYGSIAVGAGEFDEWIIGESLAVFLGEMNKSRFPLRAEEVARAFARDAIKIHNRKRPRDVNWQRWEGAADLLIRNARKQLERFHPF